MDSAECAPDQPLHLGIEGKPVGCVPPRIRNPVCRCIPRLSAILAVKGANVGVVDEHMLRIERVELHAVVGRHVESAGCPVVFRSTHGVDLCPALSSIERPIGSEEVAGVTNARVAGSHSQAKWRVVEAVLAVVRSAADCTLFDPRRIEVGRRLRRFTEYDCPALACIDGLCNAVINLLGAFAESEAAEANVRDSSIAACCGNCSKLSCLLAKLRRPRLPAPTPVLRDEQGAAFGRRKEIRDSFRFTRAGIRNLLSGPRNWLCGGLAAVDAQRSNRQPLLAAIKEQENPIRREILLMPESDSAVL